MTFFNREEKDLDVETTSTTNVANSVLIALNTSPVDTSSCTCAVPASTILSLVKPISSNTLVNYSRPDKELSMHNFDAAEKEREAQSPAEFEERIMTCDRVVHTFPEVHHQLDSLVCNPDIAENCTKNNPTPVITCAPNAAISSSLVSNIPPVDVKQPTPTMPQSHVDIIQSTNLECQMEQVHYEIMNRIVESAVPTAQEVGETSSSLSEFCTIQKSDLPVIDNELPHAIIAWLSTSEYPSKIVQNSIEISSISSLEQSAPLAQCDQPKPSSQNSNENLLGKRKSSLSLLLSKLQDIQKENCSIVNTSLQPNGKELEGKVVGRTLSSHCDRNSVLKGMVSLSASPPKKGCPPKILCHFFTTRNGRKFAQDANNKNQQLESWRARLYESSTPNLLNKAKKLLWTTTAIHEEAILKHVDRSKKLLPRITEDCLEFAHKALYLFHLLRPAVRQLLMEANIQMNTCLQRKLRRRPLYEEYFGGSEVQAQSDIASIISVVGQMLAVQQNPRLSISIGDWRWFVVCAEGLWSMCQVVGLEMAWRKACESFSAWKQQLGMCGWELWADSPQDPLVVAFKKSGWVPGEYLGIQGCGLLYALPIRKYQQGKSGIGFVDLS
ncbi:hypothetical protein BDR26DRAFT_1006734 [Obelidium mucronatum]|nr:hypothetical protein BDR26DRAFT_1006734 [Obelidium mucronatum]